ncbi:unnamed protein product [Sphagnum troendelagicum]|uniref:Uncharacterized protein n=1 Tax=Sphagnum troendelagicum TaxID=128251 RepID=A0ABP0TDB7_9BRYO
MASSSTALLSAAGSVLAAPSGASVVRLDTCSSAKQLSSSSSVAFCSSVMQLAPLRPAVNLKASRGAHVGGATRASWSEEEQKTTTASGKKVLLATVLAAGVALGISSSSTGQAFALTNPVANGAIENAQNAAGDAVNETKRRVSDGIFGKKASLADKPRSSSSGSSALEDAKARVQDFGNKSQNPIATNVEKAAKETEGLGSLGENSGSAIANRELLGQDSSRVDAATDKAENLATEFQKKAGDAVNDVKQVLSKAQEAASPAAPDLQGSFNTGVQSAKEAASKVQNPFQ